MERINTCKTPEETFALGRQLAASLAGGEIILLYGGLGAGKTLLTKGVMEGLGYDIDEVTSPSFTLVNLYKTDRFDVYHIDLWRLEAAADAGEAVGLEELLDDPLAVAIIEWADRLRHRPTTGKIIEVRIEGDGDEPSRHVTIDQDMTIANLTDPNILIEKGARRLTLFDGMVPVKTCSVVFGFAPEGDKLQEGDGRTPEGDYYVAVKNEKSKYTVSLGLSYPSTGDAARGLAEGLISRDEHDEIVASIAERRLPPQNTKLGGEIYIHGGGTEKDWTDGCVSLDDDEMRELFAAVPSGAKVTIRP